MNTHQRYQKLIPLYAADQLSQEEHKEIEAHLATCDVCREELIFWQDLSAEVTGANAQISAPPHLINRALREINSPKPRRRIFLKAFNIIRSQIHLVKKEIWPASAAVIGLGLTTALISDQAGILTFIAPLVAAASLATIYGVENDIANELTLATPTSPWKILLARLALVSGYNLLLSLAASLVLSSVIATEFIGTLVLSWLGPLTFLSALALVLSLLIGTGNSVVITYAIWTAQYIRPPLLLEQWPLYNLWECFLVKYQSFWQSPATLLCLALIFFCAALLTAQFSELRFKQHRV